MDIKMEIQKGDAEPIVQEKLKEIEQQLRNSDKEYSEEEIQRALIETGNRIRNDLISTGLYK